MKRLHSLMLAMAIGALGGPTLAAQEDAHKGHHPKGAASASASKGLPGKSSADVARMETQMKTMREMHDKMMAARTPEERNALMAEHMKAMQEGMSMMDSMSQRGMSGMKGDMAARHQMMEKRMEMMQSMMQMMMDRLPATPAK